MSLSGREIREVRILGQTPDGQGALLRVNSNGFLVLGLEQGVSDTLAARASNTSSTTRATIIIPTLGKRVRIISVNMDFVGATSNGLEVYFGPGTNIGTDGSKAITEGRQAIIGPIYELWLEGTGPVGNPDEIVSLRGTASVGEAVDLIIQYREEN